jgi:hypothetical protein
LIAKIALWAILAAVILAHRVLGRRIKFTFAHLAAVVIVSGSIMTIIYAASKFLFWAWS